MGGGIAAMRILRLRLRLCQRLVRAVKSANHLEARGYRIDHRVELAIRGCNHRCPSHPFLFLFLFFDKKNPPLSTLSTFVAVVPLVTVPNLATEDNQVVLCNSSPYVSCVTTWYLWEI
jgi:hypothetical protein